MTSLSYTSPTVGNFNSTEDPKIATALNNILTWSNGNIDLANLSATLQAYITGGAWQVLSLGTNVVAYSTYPSPAARLEAGGTIVRLRGSIQASGGSPAAGATLFTVPGGLRPPTAPGAAISTVCDFLSVTPTKPYPLNISTTGIAATVGSADGAFSSGAVIHLDGMTYSIA